MAVFNIGDRVSFLNEKGGGVITRIESDQIVYVSDMDGFEIPYAISDLIRAGIHEVAATGQRVAQEEVNTDMEPLYVVPNSKGRHEQGVYLALIPEDQENIMKSPMGVFLVNHSSYQVLFGLFLNRSGVFHGLEYGYVDAESRLFLQTVERSDANDWLNGLVQLLFFRYGKVDTLMPASAPITFKPVQAYEQTSFPYEELLRQHAWLIPLTTITKQAQILIRDNEPVSFQKKPSDKSLRATMLERQKPKAASFLDKHKVDDRIAEVDLHIGALADNIAGMSNTDILNTQMAYVRRCMEQAGEEKLLKIIFIHGIGNGTLKNELLRFLRQTENISFYDASFARYGMGATEVLFYKQQ